MKTRWIGSVDGWMGFDGAQYTRALSSPVASELTQHKKHIQFRRCVCCSYSRLAARDKEKHTE